MKKFKMFVFSAMIAACFVIITDPVTAQSPGSSTVDFRLLHPASWNAADIYVSVPVNGTGSADVWVMRSCDSIICSRWDEIPLWGVGQFSNIYHAEPLWPNQRHEVRLVVYDSLHSKTGIDKQFSFETAEMPVGIFHTDFILPDDIVRVMSMDGRCVTASVQKNRAAGDLHDLGLPAGIYLLQSLEHPDRVGKIIVQ